MGKRNVAVELDQIYFLGYSQTTTPTSALVSVAAVDLLRFQ